MSSSSPVRVEAPAKINIYLHVTGRRPDGYHLLDSVFLFPDLADIIEAAPADDLTLAIDGPYAGALAGEDLSDNLVMKAARILRSHSGERRGARLTLSKHIPVAAGVGGGSSDAVAALRALIGLWDIAIDQESLGRIALGLGADAPPFLALDPVRVRGIGEDITPLAERPDWGVVLANPGVKMPTPRIFADYRTRNAAFSAPLGAEIPWTDIDWLKAKTRNDLEPFAIARAPAIQSLLTSLKQSPDVLLARMSGSGATCFALFPDRASASLAAALLRRDHPDFRFWSCAPTSHA